MELNLDQEMDKLAHLVALRAHRKAGLPRNLQIVRPKSDPRLDPAGAPALPDWTTHQPIDLSDRAQKMHEIAMIANAHGWQIAITHFLRMKRVAYMSDLTDPQLDDLLDRMHGYVDAAVTGCSLADCLPAS